GGDGSGLYHRLAADITPVQFVGYETLTSPARILALVDGTDGLRRVTEVAEGAEVEVILDRTPAYDESGGQMGDHCALVGRRGRQGPRGGADRGPRQRAGPGQRPGHAPGDGPRRSAALGRARALRREVRPARRGHPDRRLFRGALWRHASGPDRPDRPPQGG